MARRTACNWLREARQARGWTQEQLAEHLGETFPQKNWDVDKLSRWERCRNRVGDDVLADLAEVLETDAAALKAAHDRDHGADGGRLGDALASCPEAFRLAAGCILGPDPGKALAGQLAAGGRDALKHLGEALKSATDTASLRECRALENFIAAVAVAAVQRDLSAGRVHRMELKTEERHLFAVRLLVDAALGFQMTVTVVDEEQPRRLKREAQRAFRVPVWTKAWGRADGVGRFERFHEIVAEMATTVYHPEAVDPPPPPDPDSRPAHAALFDYCETLDAELGYLNDETRHCFAYALYKEPAPVRRLFETHLPNLRLFILGCREGEEPLTLRAVDLEVWLTRSLKRVQQRRSWLKYASETPTREEPRMPVDPTVHQSGGDRSIQINVSGNDARLNIHNGSDGGDGRLQRLLAVLERIEHEASREVPVERQVLADAQTIRGDYRKRGRLSANGLAWLLASLEPGIQLGKGLLGLVRQAVDLWPKAAEEDAGADS